MKQKIKNLARAIGLKVIYSKLQDQALKWRGYHVLNQEQTIAFMSPYVLTVHTENKTQLPQIVDCTAAEKVIFEAKEVITEPHYVWEYKDLKTDAQISKYGSVIVKGKVLCLDRSSSSFYKEIWKTDHRQVLKVPVVIAPFSHFQEETGYWGYFDFVYFVIVKLCRIKDALPEEDFSKMIVSYPSFNADYEKEYLQLLGFNLQNLVDSRTTKVLSPRLLTGNGRNKHPHLTDIQSLKRHIEKKFKPVKTASDRIYISRANRRRITNEEELIALLKKFNFKIIEDKKRSITEQIDIYHNASFILGPHGASFGNIIWCQPGTHLFELFSPNYVPDFFLYLTSLMEMKYTAYYEGQPDENVFYLDGLTEDITISVAKVRECLEDIFKEESYPV